MRQKETLRHDQTLFRDRKVFEFTYARSAQPPRRPAPRACLPRTAGSPRRQPGERRPPRPARHTVCDAGKAVYRSREAGVR
ncbi:hypothetical protein [Methanoculleus taiwanensis]|uniref:hypothetical protein n=1 Tax=Methanoculleus taiwanensis TaxID=1550565 RepID=UPI000FFF10A1|nr:hypothetical protein [Methanoculleus taiwanensis]